MRKNRDSKWDKSATAGAGLRPALGLPMQSKWRTALRLALQLAGDETIEPKSCLEEYRDAH